MLPFFLSMILDCLAADMSAEEIITEYPTVTAAGASCHRVQGSAGPRGTTAPAAVTVKLNPDEYMPASSSATLATADHAVDTVSAEGLTRAPDNDVAAAGKTDAVADATAGARRHPNSR